MIQDGSSVSELDAVAKQRLESARSEIRECWNKFERGIPLDAEETPVRTAAAKRRRRSAGAGPEETMPGAEALQGERDNFLPVSFLSLGAAVARSVAQISVPAANRIGTGFLCAPGLFITNHHVLENAFQARDATIKFDFVDDPRVMPSTFRLDPARCFFSDVTTSRDFAIVAVGEQLSGQHPIDSFGFCPMSNSRDRHAIGEFANIIQHPLGEPKQVVLQDNLIVGRGDLVLHYYADTQRASSGSCVLNNDWQVIALHHWGQAVKDLQEARSYDPKSVNQGVRISQIVDFVEAGLAGQSGTGRAMLAQMLELGSTVTPMAAARQGGMPNLRGAEGSGGSAAITQPVATRTGAATWTIPLQVSVSIPGLVADGEGPQVSTHGPNPVPAAQPDTAQAAESGLPRTGEGYRPDFLDHHLIALPKMCADRQDDIAPLLEPSQHPSAKPGELQYRHFSIVMNRQRSFCFFAASNVDGSSLFGINSKGVVRAYDDEDIRDFRAKAESGAESGGKWFNDARIDVAHQTVDGWYTGKNRLVPRDDADKSKYREIADFDRGHTIRRTEPIWGTEQAGREANYQSHAMTNVLPQQPLFNRDKRRGDGQIDPGEETRSWFGMEVAVLRAASDDNAKMNVFSGPVFKDTDPFYDEGRPNRGGPRQIPLSYWKIAVWEDGETLKSVAMKASQDWSLAPLPEDGSESLSDPAQMVLISDFLTSVKDIEKETGIIFDPKVVKADILKGKSAAQIKAMKFADFKALAGNGE
ncbi:MAG: DNA/RNA non-specific endonuclease [Pseudomonadota bacterium]|nr:DNA/RNA non-specific endonuclease [Pseudomonadota bacterium]